MKKHKLKYPVEMMSKALDVSKSGYYNWLKSGPSSRWLENRKIIELIEYVFEESHQSITYNGWQLRNMRNSTKV